MSEESMIAKADIMVAGKAVARGEDFTCSNRDADYLQNIGKAERKVIEKAKKKGLDTSSGGAVVKNAGK